MNIITTIEVRLKEIENILDNCENEEQVYDLCEEKRYLLSKLDDIE